MKKLILLLCLCIFWSCSDAPESTPAPSGPKKHDLQRISGPTYEKVTSGSIEYSQYRSLYQCKYCGASAEYLEPGGRISCTNSQWEVIIKPQISNYNYLHFEQISDLLEKIKKKDSENFRVQKV